MKKTGVKAGEKIMNIAIIGCGLIGNKRAKSIKEKNKLVAVCDIDIKKAETFKKYNPDIFITSDWKEIINIPEVDMVIISTTNNLLAVITQESVKAGKHVLVEKPAARNYSELEEIISVIDKSKKKVKVGFNLRYHPALKKAKEIYDTGCLDELMFIRGRYGHGGRLGYENEWRAKPEISGGGELLDQGIHLIDLSGWFCGDFIEISGYAVNYYWQMPVEDNGFITLRTKNNRIAWLHVSCTEWKNIFSFEIYCKKGKLMIEGLGGSYGVERLYYYKMLPQMGPPETAIWEYPGDDTSWENELHDFIKSINENKAIEGSIYEAYEALKIVDKIYSKGIFK